MLSHVGRLAGHAACDGGARVAGHRPTHHARQALDGEKIGRIVTRLAWRTWTLRARYAVLRRELARAAWHKALSRAGPTRCDGPQRGRAVQGLSRLGRRSNLCCVNRAHLARGGAQRGRERVQRTHVARRSARCGGEASRSTRDAVRRRRIWSVTRRAGQALKCAWD